MSWLVSRCPPKASCTHVCGFREVAGSSRRNWIYLNGDDTTQCKDLGFSPQYINEWLYEK